jgi:TRAP-type C4-dicarboxylate transport system permease large subunit
VPLGYIYGIDPVHLGIIFIINLEVGFLTPPVGMNLFLASYRFEKPFMQICRSVLPFLLIQFAVVLLVTYIPPLSTWLPGFFK